MDDFSDFSDLIPDIEIPQVDFSDVSLDFTKEEEDEVLANIFGEKREILESDDYDFSSVLQPCDYYKTKILNKLLPPADDELIDLDESSRVALSGLLRFLLDEEKIRFRKTETGDIKAIICNMVEVFNYTAVEVSFQQVPCISGDDFLEKFNIADLDIELMEHKFSQNYISAVNRDCISRLLYLSQYKQKLEELIIIKTHLANSCAKFISELNRASVGIMRVDREIVKFLHYSKVKYTNSLKDLLEGIKGLGYKVKEAESYYEKYINAIKRSDYGLVVIMDNEGKDVPKNN